MNIFHNLVQNIDNLFGQVKDYFIVIKFQVGRLVHDHGLLWLTHAPKFEVSSLKTSKKNSINI
jgi:hypothetical protein